MYKQRAETLIHGKRKRSPKKTIVSIIRNVFLDALQPDCGYAIFLDADECH